MALAGGEKIIRLFGPPRLSGGGSLPRMAFVAAALIDVTIGRRIDRPQLAGILWENADTQRAAGNLRETLRRVRTWDTANGLALFRLTTSEVARDETTVPSDLALFLTLSVPQASSLA